MCQSRSLGTLRRVATYYRKHVRGDLIWWDLAICLEDVACTVIEILDLWGVPITSVLVCSLFLCHAEVVEACESMMRE